MTQPTKTTATSADAITVSSLMSKTSTDSLNTTRNAQHAATTVPLIPSPKPIASNHVEHRDDEKITSPPNGRFIKRSSSDLGMCIEVRTGVEEFNRRYSLGAQCGGGGFGLVYRSKRIEDNQDVVVKTVFAEKVPCWCELDSRYMPMEAVLLTMCQSVPGIVNLLEVHDLSKQWAFVMNPISTETCDLFDYIGEQGSLTEPEAAYFFYQLVGILFGCHRVGVLHRDIKDENLLVNRLTNELVLIDFGSGTFLEPGLYTDFDGTRVYSPPEWIQQQCYDGKQAEIWSMGVLLYDMLCGDIPFVNDRGITAGKLRYRKDNLSDFAKDLISKCMSMDPNGRPTLMEILNHPWMLQHKPTDLSLIPSSIVIALAALYPTSIPNTIERLTSPRSSQTPVYSQNSVSSTYDSALPLSMQSHVSNVDTDLAAFFNIELVPVIDPMVESFLSDVDKDPIIDWFISTPSHSTGTVSSIRGDSIATVKSTLTAHNNASAHLQDDGTLLNMIASIRPHSNDSEASSGYCSQSDCMSSNDSLQPVSSVTSSLPLTFSTSTHAASVICFPASPKFLPPCSPIVRSTTSLSRPVHDSLCSTYCWRSDSACVRNSPSSPLSSNSYFRQTSETIGSSYTHSYTTDSFKHPSVSSRQMTTNVPTVDFDIGSNSPSSTKSCCWLSQTAPDTTDSPNIYPNTYSSIPMFCSEHPDSRSPMTLVAQDSLNHLYQHLPPSIVKNENFRYNGRKQTQNPVAIGNTGSAVSYYERFARPGHLFH